MTAKLSAIQFVFFKDKQEPVGLLGLWASLSSEPHQIYQQADAGSNGAISGGIKGIQLTIIHKDDRLDFSIAPKLTKNKDEMNVFFQDPDKKIEDALEFIKGINLSFQIKRFGCICKYSLASGSQEEVNRVFSEVSSVSDIGPADNSLILNINKPFIVKEKEKEWRMNRVTKLHTSNVIPPGAFYLDGETLSETDTVGPFFLYVDVDTNSAVGQPEFEFVDFLEILPNIKQRLSYN